MAFRASYRFARISPRKVRALADMIRGKYADEALNLLRFQPQRGARMLEKAIHSALGSAQDPDQNRGRRYRGARGRRPHVQAGPTTRSRDGDDDPEAHVAHSYHAARY